MLLPLIRFWFRNSFSALAVMCISILAAASEPASNDRSTLLLADNYCRYIPGGCQKASVPYTWTDQERSQFNDSLDRYPKWELPKIRSNHESKVFWLNDKKLLLSVRELSDGWKAEEQEKSKIVTIDTDTGAIEETGYRGEVICYSPMRMIVADYPRHYPIYMKSRDGQKVANQYVAGVFGEKLLPLEWPSKGYLISSPSCEIAPRDGGTGDSVSVIPLRSGDGSLRFHHRGLDEFKLFWVNEVGERILEFPKGARAPVENSVIFLNWLNAYFISDAIPNTQQLLFLEGSVHQVRTPKLLADWNAAHVGGGYAYAVRPGVLWNFRPRTGYFHKQGLYLEKDGSLLRIDDGEVVVRWAPSPDGCRFFYGRVQGEYRKSRNDVRDLHRNFVIDFCKGESR